jgi:hypothetical protein
MTKIENHLQAPLEKMSGHKIELLENGATTIIGDHLYPKAT